MAGRGACAKHRQIAAEGRPAITSVRMAPSCLIMPRNRSRPLIKCRKRQSARKKIRTPQKIPHTPVPWFYYRPTACHVRILRALVIPTPRPETPTATPYLATLSGLLRLSSALSCSTDLQVFRLPNNLSRSANPAIPRFAFFLSPSFSANANPINFLLSSWIPRTLSSMLPSTTSRNTFVSRF